MYDSQLRTDPTPMPLGPAVLILLHKRRKYAFVSYSSNARGRAAVISSAIRHRKKLKRQHLRDLPEGEVKDFALLATHFDLPAAKAEATLKRVRAKLERDGYRLFGGNRSAVPMVLLNGKRMSLVKAMAAAKCKVGYQTAYRRIRRGWPVEQALDLDARQ